MMMRLIPWMVLLALAISGCRSTDPSVELLESELRWMEDQLYLAENEYRKKCAELSDCDGKESGDSKSAASERRPLFGRRGAESAPNSASPRSNRAPEGSSTPDPERGQTPELSAPTIEPGEPAEPEVQLPQSSLEPVGSAVRNVRAQHQEDVEPAPLDAHVTHIHLYPLHQDEVTIASPPDEEDPGDPGYETIQTQLSLVVQPRNSEGQYVALPGTLSVVAIDPDRQGSASRCGRWDLDAVETARLIRKSEDGTGIHLALPWQQEDSPADGLRVFVRYTTVDGRKLEAECGFGDSPVSTDAPPPQVAGGWTPAARSAPDSQDLALPASTTETTPTDESSAHGNLARSTVPRSFQPPSDVKSINSVDTDAVTPATHAEPTRVASDRQASHSDGDPTPPSTRKIRRVRPSWRPYR